MTMINQQEPKNQLPKEIQSNFNDLNILKHLRNAGFRKSTGFSCAYLFQIIFCLIFHHRNWFRLLESPQGEGLPAKDAIYRFLNNPNLSWRRFFSSLSSETIQTVSSLTHKKRVKVFIVDDSTYDRNRSKAVELLARFKDHTTGNYYKGFRMLTLGWSDGHTFIPVDFSLLSSLKSAVNHISLLIDKRSCGYKRRIEALQSSPETIPSMIDRALRSGIEASHVLMDSWFTYAPLIQKLVDRGLDVIGMVKNTNQRYLVGSYRLSLSELYKAAPSVPGSKRTILRSIFTQLAPGIPVKVVFVRHRNHKKEWLAILSTDCTLTEEEIIQIYGIRWDIETFFKCTKSLLRLQKEFQGRSYDSLISHTTIVFARYILLAWQHRQNTDERTLGGLFFALCDEVGALDWAIALQQLLEILQTVATKVNKTIKNLVESQLQYWFAGLPSYIKVYLPNLCCES